MDQGQGRAREAAARAGEVSRAVSASRPRTCWPRCRRCSTSICELSRLSVYANALSDEDVRAARPREMKQAAEELATAFSAASSWVRPEILTLDPAKVRKWIGAGAEARALPGVPGRDAAPQAAHAGRRRGEGRRRGGRAASARAARCTACSPTPTCRTRPSSCRRASRCAWTRPRTRCTGRRACAPIATRCSRRSSARSRPTSARWARRWPRR